MVTQRAATSPGVCAARLGSRPTRRVDLDMDQGAEEGALAGYGHAVPLASRAHAMRRVLRLFW